MTSSLLLAIVLLVFAAAVTRYLGAPINWSVDIAQALFVWVIFVGASQAMRGSDHIGVSIVVDRLPESARTVIEIAVGVVVVIFLAGIIVYGVQISIVNYRRILQSIPVSYSLVTVAVPVGALLMLLTTVQKIIANIRLLTMPIPMQSGAANDKLTSRGAGTKR